MGVAWHDDDYGIYFSLYDPSTNSYAYEKIQVTPTTLGGDSSLSFIDSSNLLHVFSHRDENSSGETAYNVNAHTVNLDNPIADLGIELSYQHNQYLQADPKIARLNNGEYLAVWASYGQDGQYYGIFSNILNSSGELQRSSDFQVNSESRGSSYKPKIIPTHDGLYCVWYNAQYGTFAQKFDVNGDPSGSNFEIDASIETLTSGINNGALALSSDKQKLISFSADLSVNFQKDISNSLDQFNLGAPIRIIENNNNFILIGISKNEELLLLNIEKHGTTFHDPIVIADSVRAYNDLSYVRNNDDVFLAYGTFGDYHDLNLMHLDLQAASPPSISTVTNLNTSEDSSLVAVEFYGIDIDGDTLIFSFGTPNHGTVVDNNDGTYTYTPNPNYHGLDNFTLTVRDGTFSASETVSITISPVNDAPIISTLNTLTIDEDVTTTPIAFNAFDADGDSLTYSFSTPWNGTVVNNGNGTFTYTPSANFNGSDDFTLTVNDGTVDVVERINVTVNAVNDAPTLTTTTSISTNEDTPSTAIPFTVNDVDGDTVGVSFDGPSNGLVVNNYDGTYTYTPNANFNGTDSFSIIARDGPSELIKPITVSVNPVNDVPIITSSEKTTVTENNPFSYTLTASDIDGDALTLSATTLPSWLQFNASTGVLSGTPDATDVGTHAVVLRATDLSGAHDEQAFEIEVKKYVDVAGPRLDAVSISRTEYSVGETIEIDYQTSDETGLQGITFNYDDEAGNRHWIRGHLEDGTATLKVEDYFPPGTYTLAHVWLGDTNGTRNEALYMPDGRIAYDPTKTTHSFDLTALNFTVISPPVVVLPDETGPIINSLSIRDRSVEIGDTVYIDYSVIEETGTEVFAFWFKDKNNNQFFAKDNDNDGIAELEIKEGYLDGTYTPWFISTLDNSPLNNSLTYHSNGDLTGDNPPSATHNLNLSDFSFTVSNPTPVDETGLKFGVTSSRQSEAFDGDPASYPNADVYAFATGNDEDLFLRAISLGDVTTYEVVATPDADIQSFGLELASTSGLDISDFVVGAATAAALGGVILPNVISANEISVAAISTSGSLTGNQEHVLATFKTTGVGTLSITNGQIGTDGIPTLSYDISKATTNSSGSFNLTFDNGDAVQLQAQADYVVPSTNPITPSDALEVLKTVVRINQSPTPEQLIAGDVDMDGKLTPSDALSILKKVVRMDGGVEPEWIFIDGDKDYSSLSFTNVDYDNMIDIASIAADTTINFEGILLGDFDGTL